MTEDPTPTTMRRQLGARLRELRRQHDLTIEQVADRLKVAVSTVSRLETGARALSAIYQERLVEPYGLEGAEADLVRALALSGRRRASLGSPPPTRETDYVKIEQIDFVELERDAARIREFNSGQSSRVIGN